MHSTCVYSLDKAVCPLFQSRDKDRDSLANCAEVAEGRTPPVVPSVLSLLQLAWQGGETARVLVQSLLS